MMPMGKSKLSGKIVVLVVIVIIIIYYFVFRNAVIGAH